MKRITKIFVFFIFVFGSLSILNLVQPLAAQSIIDLVGSSKENQRLKGARMLCQNPDNTYLSNLIQLAEDQSDEVKTAAVAALYNLAKHQRIQEAIPKEQIDEVCLKVITSYISTDKGKIDSGYQTRIINNKKEYLTIYSSSAGETLNSWNNLALRGLESITAKFLQDKNIRTGTESCKYILLMIYQRAILESLGKVVQQMKYEHRIYRFLIENDMKNIISCKRWIKYQDISSPSTYIPGWKDLCLEAMNYLLD